MEISTPPHLPTLKPHPDNIVVDFKKHLPLIKLLAMTVFVLLPFLGFYLGLSYQKSVSTASPSQPIVQPSSSPTPSQSETPIWQDHINQGYGFTFKYPNSFTSNSPEEPYFHMQELQISLISNQSEYKQSNFIQESVFAVSINLWDTALCFYNPRDHSPLTKTENLNGTQFYVGDFFGVAAGNHYDQTFYRTLQGQTCIEIALTVHQGSDWNNVDFKAADHSRSLAMYELNQILATFRFGTEDNPLPGELKKYTDPKSRFSLMYYPDIFQLTDQTRIVAQDEAITPLVTLKSDLDSSSGYNFVRTWFSIAQVKLASQEKCLTDVSHYMIFKNTYTFEKIPYSEGAGGRMWTGDFYRTVQNNTCYQITSLVETVRNDEGSDEDLQASTMQKQQKLLNQLLWSFNFTPKLTTTMPDGQQGPDTSDQLKLIGQVQDNQIKSPVDGQDVLTLTVNGTQYSVIYFYGESPQCPNTKASQQGRAIQKGDYVELFAYQTNSPSELTTCPTNDYYVKKLN